VSDQDRIKAICIKLKNHLETSTDKLLDLLDELEELMEIQARNNFNLCVCGGMETLISIIFLSPHNEVRRKCCSIIAEAN
jgi:hypothetical protein